MSVSEYNGVSQSKHYLPKWYLLILIGVYTMVIVVLGNLLLHPPVSRNHVDCHKAMELWNHHEGQAAIAAFKGQESKAKQLKLDYEKLVLSHAPTCFPKELKDYLIQNP